MASFYPLQRGLGVRQRSHFTGSKSVQPFRISRNEQKFGHFTDLGNAFIAEALDLPLIATKQLYLTFERFSPLVLRAVERKCTSLFFPTISRLDPQALTVSFLLDLHRTPDHTQIQDPCLPHFHRTTSLAYKLEVSKTFTFPCVSGQLLYQLLCPLDTSLGFPAALIMRNSFPTDLRKWYWVIGRWLRKVVDGPPSHSDG